MINPRLIHPVSVKLMRLNRTAMLAAQDPDFYEPNPSGRIEETELVVNAQVSWAKHKGLTPTKAGDLRQSSGHLTINRCELMKHVETAESAIALIRKGDRVTEIDGVTDELFITEVRPQGHYCGKWNLLYVFFISRDQSA